jgi:spermidine/putrescine transport system permease protein
LRNAARAGKKVGLNNDPKNIFAIAAEVLFQKPNLTSYEEIAQASDYLNDNFIKRPNVTLNNDELVDNVGSGRFDFAMMYNGDAMEANRIYNGEDVSDGKDDYHLNQIDKTKFLFGRPNIAVGSRYETTNVFSDNIVISKASNHKDLAYKFINFLTENSKDISKYVGITSPVQMTMDDLTAPGAIFHDYKTLYEPAMIDEYKVNGTELLAFDYLPNFDEKLVDDYNELIAGKIG